MASKDTGIKLVRKANDLVEARYKFNIWETRIFTKMLTMVRKDDTDFQEYKIFLRDIITEFGLEKNRQSYQLLSDGADRLMNKIVTIIKKKDDGVIEKFKTPIIAGVKSFEGKLQYKKTYIGISFHPEMRPYLLELQREYLLYDVRNILKLPSGHSIRIYELLKQYEKIGKRTFFIDNLKAILGIEDKYPKFANLRQRVIDKAQIDLAEHTDISFTYEVIKRGRRIEKITFFINKNIPKRQERFQEQQKAQPDDASNGELFNDLYPLVKEWVSETDLKSWIDTFPAEQVRKGINYTLNLLHLNKLIDNVGGYMRRMVEKEDLVDPTEAKKEAAKKAKKLQREQAAKKATLEEELKALNQEQGREEAKVIEELFAKEDAKAAIIEQAKLHPMGKYDSSKSEEDNIAVNMFFRIAVNNAAKQLYSDAFQGVEAAYGPKIEALEQELRFL